MHSVHGRQSAVSGELHRIPVKENRKKLFRKSRPFIRPFVFSDMGWLWTAYKLGSFNIPSGLDQPTFAAEIQARLGLHETLIVDDDSSKFKSKRGPVALICATDDGWRYEPVFMFFKWATKRNMLRVAVSFFHMSSLSSKVGVCLVRCEKSALLEHMKKYGVLFPRGKIPMGRINGDEYIYSILGRKGSKALKAK